MKPAAEPIPCTLDVLSSEELACRAQAGSLPCFAELVHRYQGRLYNFLLRRNGNRIDAEDLTQETFLRAWERLHQYKPKWRFSTWLFTIGSRLAINHHRAGARLRRQDLAGSSLDQFPTEFEEDPSERSLRHESIQRVWEVARCLLTPEQHSMVWLRYAEDLSASEIARVLGKSQVTVRVALHRARARIAAALHTHDEKSLLTGKHSGDSPGGRPVNALPVSAPMPGGVT